MFFENLLVISHAMRQKPLDVCLLAPFPQRRAPSVSPWLLSACFWKAAVLTTVPTKSLRVACFLVISVPLYSVLSVSRSFRSSHVGVAPGRSVDEEL